MLNRQDKTTSVKHPNSIKKGINTYTHLLSPLTLGDLLLIVHTVGCDLEDLVGSMRYDLMMLFTVPDILYLRLQ